MRPLDSVRIAGRFRDLPPLPSIVLDLITSIERDDIDTAGLTEKISRDQALSAKMLRLANSSFYGLPSRIGTVKQAILVLGFNTVRTLTLASTVIASFEGSGAGSIDLTGFWRHSIATALCARALARHAGLSLELGFIAGLLHDIGRMVLACEFLDHYGLVIEYCVRRETTLCAAERHVLGIDHQCVGELLSENWKFPLEIQRALGQHHAPPDGELANLAGLIHAANAVVHALDLGCNEQAAVSVLDDKVWTALHIAPEQLLDACRETEVLFEECCQLLLNTGAPSAD